LHVCNAASQTKWHRRDCAGFAVASREPQLARERLLDAIESAREEQRMAEIMKREKERRGKSPRPARLKRNPRIETETRRAKERRRRSSGLEASQRDSAIYETSSNFRQSAAAVILGALLPGNSTKTKVKTRLVTRTLRMT